MSYELNKSFIAAVKAGDVGEMNAALRAGADLYTREGGICALTVAIQHHRENAAADLLDTHHFDPNFGADRKDTSPLMVACGWGQTAIAKRLIAAGADLDYKNDFGDNALSWAVEFCYKDSVDLLLDAGAEPRDVAANAHYIVREKPECVETAKHLTRRVAEEFSNAALAVKAEAQQRDAVDDAVRGLREGLPETVTMKPLRLRIGPHQFLILNK